MSHLRKTQSYLFLGITLALGGMFVVWQGVWADTESGATQIEFQVGPDDPTPPSICGNGIVEPGEACDAGASNGSCPATCSASCTINSCGGPGTGGGNAPVITIISTESTYSTIDLTWTASPGPITGCVTAWGTTVGGPYASSTSAYTDTFGTFATTLPGLAPETTYYISVTCTNEHNLSGSAITEETTLELPDMALVPIHIIAIPEKRVPQPGGNLDTDFMVFIFDPSETMLLATIAGTSAGDGTYTGEHEVPIGSGYVAIHKSDSHLAKKIINSTFSDTDPNTLDFSANGTFELIAGDVRPVHPQYRVLNDNIIEILDITYIDSNNIINTDDRIADLNRDGIVDILDLTLVDGNADLQGDTISIL